MDRSPNGDGRGIQIYKRKRKNLIPEADGDDNRVEEELRVEVDQRGMEQEGGASTSNAQIGTAMAQQGPNEQAVVVMVLRDEALQKKPVEEEAYDKPKQNNEEKFNEVQQVAPEQYLPVMIKEEYGLPPRRQQRGRLLFRTEATVKLPEILKGGGANAPSSSSMMSLKGKGIALPHAALLPKLTQNASGSGLLQPSASSLNNNNNENDPKLTLFGRKPAGYLKRNTKPNDWSELELDSLWVGVRRFGQDNWERILTDSPGYIFNNRTPQELANRWKMVELPKIIPLPQPTAAASVFPPIYGTCSHSRTPPPPPQGPVLNPNLQPKIVLGRLINTNQRANNQEMNNSRSVKTEAPAEAGKVNWFSGTRPAEFPPRVRDKKRKNLDLDLNLPPAMPSPVKKTMNLFPMRPEFHWNDKHKLPGGRDNPIAVDSDSESEGSEKTLSA